MYFSTQTTLLYNRITNTNANENNQQKLTLSVKMC